MNGKHLLAAGLGCLLVAAPSLAQVTATPGPARSPLWVDGSLTDVSFFGYTPPAAFGPNAPRRLPGAFRNQALELRFDGVLDAGVHGGFFIVGGSPVQLVGASPSGTPVPYFPFVDQVNAKISVQVRENSAGGPLLASYIVGRHATKPDTIVIDPYVPPGYPIPANTGFKANQEYVFGVPAGNGLMFSGHPANPVGPTAVPFVVSLTPSFVSGLFRTTATFAPDPNPPMVVSIAAQSGNPGTPANPILAAEPIIVTFSKLVRGASLDPVRNFVVRNLFVTPATMPGGALVPGTIAPLTPGATDDLAWVFTPAAAYGPGTAPGVGFDIEVRIGSFGQPPLVAPPILGVPQGILGSQLPLGNSLASTLRTTSCGACPTIVAIGEGFDDTTQLDTTFVQTFGPPNPGSQARWGQASAPSQLAGRLTTGAANGTTPATLGTRIQVLVDPMPPSTNPAGLFSPFDSNLASSGGQCPSIPTGCNLGVNPNGGSHIMHLYESADLGNIEDSLEQIEWSPLNATVFASTYPQYRVWCGVTSTAAPLNPPSGVGVGMSTVFDYNYNLSPYQTGVSLQAFCTPSGVLNPRKVPCGGPAPYTTPVGITQFVAFPLLSPCFDFATSAGAAGAGVNLLVEQNIEPGNQVPNYNRYRATAFIPTRRLLDAPLSANPPGVCPFNHGGTFDIYRMRFTFVGISGQARSLWYDTAVPNPNYLGFAITPSVASQPAGTQSTWTLEGTDTSNPTPATTGTSGVYVNAAGTVFPLVVTNTINQLRYFRFKVEIRGDNVTNATPAYTSVAMAYSF